MVAGAIAAVAGFGIGSVLTPLVSVQVGTKLAVAVVAIPHMAGTALRFWMMRRSIDHDILRGFGLASAVGGLTGALVHSLAASRALTAIFAALLLFAGAMGLIGRADRMRFRGRWAWLAGAASGALGGLVGNQGGIRSAAMLGLEVPRHAFVATATAIALLVDLARVPVYVATQARELRGTWPLMAVATGGVLVGTVAGERLLKLIPERIFRRMVSAIILALGLFMVSRV